MLRNGESNMTFKAKAFFLLITGLSLAVKERNNAHCNQQRGFILTNYHLCRNQLLHKGPKAVTAHPCSHTSLLKTVQGKRAVDFLSPPALDEECTLLNTGCFSLLSIPYLYTVEIVDQGLSSPQHSSEGMRLICPFKHLSAPLILGPSGYLARPMHI